MTESITTDNEMDDDYERHLKLMGILDNQYPVNKELIYEEDVILNRQNSEANWWALIVDTNLVTIFDATAVDSTLALRRQIEKMTESARSTDDTPSTVGGSIH